MMQGNGRIEGFPSMVAGVLLLGSGVVLGAFGAHGLGEDLAPATRAAWQTAVQYQLVHGLALFVLGAIADRLPAGQIRGHAAFLLGAGCVLFSGSIYWLSLGGPWWLGPVTPLGGVTMIMGWVWVLRWLWLARGQSTQSAG
ncbi:DUF423 domain-containing protein [Spiribacter onubensis]|jgi:uncharacterized membrane protein YgdD (TMEM256/DUF423 family)|uniref:DUF423 domain-containing protein n=1 Tax=Spiribacter onubensis TaxID=3122420 RepID=A0ABV3S6B4_9GAMM